MMTDRYFWRESVMSDERGRYYLQDREDDTAPLAVYQEQVGLFLTDPGRQALAAVLNDLAGRQKQSSWRAIDSDTAFASPFGTIRQCDCGALVGGGPTRCARCAREMLAEAQAEKQAEPVEPAARPCSCEEAEELRKQLSDTEDARDAASEALGSVARERDAARAEVPDWCKEFIKFARIQAEYYGGTLTDMYRALTPDQLRACGIEMP